MDYKKMWKERKWLFFLLLPVIILFVVNEVIDNMADNGRKRLFKTEEDDRKLKAEADKANTEAEKHLAKSERIEDEINTTTGDEDWHEKV